MPHKINRIIFTGDALRSEGGEPHQLQNVIWLKKQLGDLLERLTGLPLEIRFPLTGADVKAFTALQGFKRPCLEEWALHYHQPASDILVERIATEFKGALIIAIEMPPIIENALDRAQIPWIDVGVSPLRFMPDWALHVKHSHHFEAPSLAGFELGQDEIGKYVSQVKAYYSPMPPQKRNLVFFCQTLKDRTLIHNQQFAGVREVEAWFETSARDFTLLIKPHPWLPVNPIIEFLQKVGGKITSENTYALLATNDTGVATLSSSVGLEAEYFGQAATIICPAVQKWAFSGINILRYAQSPVFWASVLNQLSIVTRALIEPAWLPPRLRMDAAAQGLDPKIWRAMK